jgi:hypothetical protein
MLWLFKMYLNIKQLYKCYLIPIRIHVIIVYVYICLKVISHENQLHNIICSTAVINIFYFSLLVKHCVGTINVHVILNKKKKKPKKLEYLVSCLNGRHLI